MKILLPMFFQRLVQLNEDLSDLSVLTQKQILKIFFTFVQVSIEFISFLNFNKQNLQFLKVCIST
jgi:hypothetical protein